MWRALVYIGILCLVALGAVWLSQLSGEVTILLPNYVANIELPAAAALLVALGFAIALIWWLIGAIFRLPFRIGRASKTKRRAKGYQALSRGMVAVGAGDTAKARRYAKDAQRLLGEEPLTLLLNAQVAQVTGDRNNAETAFKRMAANDETRLLGLRGLFIEARRQGDNATAYRYADDANKLAPAAAWANEAVLEARCNAGQWSEALAMVEKRASLGLIDKPTAKRQRAVLLTAVAIAQETSDPEVALNSVTSALKFDPTLIPAATLAGRMSGRRNDVRKAAKIIEKAWRANPHPDLSDIYIYLRGGDSARDRLKRAETLGKLGNWQPEARNAIAHAALEARQFQRAREVLAPLLADRPTMRVCLLMADIEQEEHGSIGHAREWVARASRAPRDPAWIADGVVSDHWEPFSPLTGTLDAFVWKTPPDVLTAPERSSLDIENELPRAEETIDAALIAASQVTRPEPLSDVVAVEPKTAAAEVVTEESEAEIIVAETESTAHAPVEVEHIPASVAEPSNEPAMPAPVPTEAENGKPDAELPATEPDASATEPSEPAEPTPSVKKPSGPISIAPKPVIFPIQHAPDDPGPEEQVEAAGKRKP